jgi:predicted NACHT family NTPase
MKNLRGHEMQRCEGIEVVKRSNSHRLFILGKPGAGKTTFLKYVTLQAVKGELPQNADICRFARMVRKQ